MRGVIIIPTFYKKRHADSTGRSARSHLLLNEISKTYNFPIVYTNTPKLENLDVAVIYAVPHHNRPEIPSGLLNTKTKLIGLYQDLQCWGNKECEKNKKIMFDRYDILVGAYKERFDIWYPQHVHKSVFFPNFFTPDVAYTRLGVNSHPKMKCLLSGSATTRYYPFRAYIRKNASSTLMVYKDRSAVKFKEYPRFLHEYFCAIATASAARVAVTKYFEIPAAGVLLLAETIGDLDVIGLKPYTHYVPITKENIFKQVKKCLTSPEKFVKIRDNGTSFVRRNHSIRNRVVQFGEILRRI